MRDIAQENKAIILQFYEEMEKKGNLDIIDEILTTDCVLHFPGGVDIHGPEGYKEFRAPLDAALSGLKHSIEDMIVEGDKVVVRFILRGTYRGEFMGITPTGKQIMLTSIAIYRIAGDKVVEVWCNADDFGLFQQLGVISPIGPAEK